MRRCLQIDPNPPYDYSNRFNALDKFDNRDSFGSFDIFEVLTKSRDVTYLTILSHFMITARHKLSVAQSTVESCRVH